MSTRRASARRQPLSQDASQQPLETNAHGCEELARAEDLGGGSLIPPANRTRDRRATERYSPEPQTRRTRARVPAASGHAILPARPTEGAPQKMSLFDVDAPEPPSKTAGAHDPAQKAAVLCKIFRALNLALPPRLENTPQAGPSAMAVVDVASGANAAEGDEASPEEPVVNTLPATLASRLYARKATPGQQKWSLSVYNARLVPLEMDVTTEEGRATVTRAARWVADDTPGYKSSDREKKQHKARINAFQTGMQAVFSIFQCLNNTFEKKKLSEYTDVSNAYETLGRMLDSKGGYFDPQCKVDPQLYRTADSFTKQNLEEMAMNFLNDDDPVAVKWSAMCTFSFSSLARGNDARQLALAALCAPIHNASISPCHNFIIPIMIQFGKTQNYKSDYKGAVRSLDHKVCAQGHIGRYLLQRFTLDKEPFPEPHTENWKRTMLFAGATPTSEINYDGHNSSVKRQFKKMNLNLASVTHAFRSAGAQYLESVGLNPQLICRAGQWSQSVMELTYLTFFPPALVLAAGGVPGAATNEFTNWWSPRFLMNCPVELVDKMYPFLPQLRDNFKKFQAANIPAPSVESLIKTFTYLAGVVFQDALEYLRLGQCFDAEKQIRNRPILWLTQQQEFKSEFMHYKLLHDCGVFEALKPRSVSEKLDAVMSRLDALMSGNSGIASRMGQTFALSDAIAVLELRTHKGMDYEAVEAEKQKQEEALDAIEKNPTEEAAVEKALGQQVQKNNEAALLAFASPSKKTASPRPDLLGTSRINLEADFLAAAPSSAPSNAGAVAVAEPQLKDAILPQLFQEDDLFSERDSMQQDEEEIMEPAGPLSQQQLLATDLLPQPPPQQRQGATPAPRQLLPSNAQQQAIQMLHNGQNAINNGDILHISKGDYMAALQRAAATGTISGTALPFESNLSAEAQMHTSQPRATITSMAPALAPAPVPAAAAYSGSYFNQFSGPYQQNLQPPLPQCLPFGGSLNAQAYPSIQVPASTAHSLHGCSTATAGFDNFRAMVDQATAQVEEDAKTVAKGRKIQRGIPLTTAFSTLEAVLNWMESISVEGRWSIIDCEFRYQNLGLTTPYTKWRQGERKRWLVFSKFWRELQEVKTRQPSKSVLPGE